MCRNHAPIEDRDGRSGPETTVHIVTRWRPGSSGYAEDTFKVLLSFVKSAGALPSQGADYLLGSHVEEDQE